LTKTLLTLEETAEMLRMKPGSVYELTRNRTRARHKHPLPVIRIGSALRFCKEDIERWLELLAEES
jgi:excisionase family DNA binding protein